MTIDVAADEEEKEKYSAVPEHEEKEEPAQGFDAEIDEKKRRRSWSGMPRIPGLLLRMKDIHGGPVTPALRSSIRGLARNGIICLSRAVHSLRNLSVSMPQRTIHQNTRVIGGLRTPQHSRLQQQLTPPRVIPPRSGINGSGLFIPFASHSNKLPIHALHRFVTATSVTLRSGDSSMSTATTEQQPLNISSIVTGPGTVAS